MFHNNHLVEHRLLVRGGGTVSPENNLRFSVEESVWFEKGQEVSQVLSMALDPEISIQEHENYISIRGALQLTGDYYPYENDESEFPLLSEKQNVRTVDSVNRDESGLCQLSHQFPVDITVPKSRIKNTDDVYVMIESFDYELPEKNQLELSAELSISGISDGNREMSTVAEPPSNKTDVDNDGKVEPLFKEEPSENREEDNSNQNVNEESIEGEETEEKAEEKFPSFEAEARKINDDSSLTDNDEDEESTSPLIEMKGREEEEELTYDDKEEENFVEDNQVEEGVESVNTPEEKYSIRDENALYLTKIFDNVEGEDFSKLRMRIIQSGESLDEIAETYEISVSQLIRFNRLDDDDISEGQILYIPKTVSNEA